MNEYELVYIVQADLDEAALSAVIDRVNDLIKANNGEVKKSERWGKRRIAYPIRKMNEGFYVLANYLLDPLADTELRRSLKYIEQILRFIIKKVG